MSSNGQRRVDVEAGQMLDDERVVHVAQFDPKYINYTIATIIIWAFVTFIGMPFLIFLPCMIYGIKASFNSRELVVTEKTIVFKSGMYGCCCMFWNQTSKHVPLEKVTDVTFSQGCLERSYGLATIGIQTAGQSNPNGGPELQVTGIVDAAAFRKIVMTAKAQHQASIYGGGATAVARPLKSAGATAGAVIPSSSEATNALLAVRDTLNRIERRVETIEVSLTSRNPPSN